MKNKTLILVFAVIWAAGLFSCSKKKNEDAQPTTNDTATADAPLDFSVSGNLLAGHKVKFTANRILEYVSWGFGDGVSYSYVNTREATHVYERGTYDVTLIADGDSTKAVKKTIVIKPYYHFSYAGGIATGDTIFFTSDTYPQTGNTYKWTFGDGATSTDANPYHIYTSSGEYSIQLIINNDEENSVRKTITIYKDPIYTYKLAGKRMFYDCKLVKKSVGATTDTTYLADTLLDISYVDKLTLKYSWDKYMYNEDKSSGNVISYEKIISGPVDFDHMQPGSFEYYIVEDSISFMKFQHGTVHGSSSGYLHDYTFTCQTQ